MAAQTSPRRFSWLDIVKVLAIAAVFGVSLPYLGSLVMPEQKQAAAKSAPPAPPPAPPKMDFLGAGTISGTQASLNKGDVKETTDVGADDAMVIWMKMVSASGGGGRGGPPISIKDDAGNDYTYSTERKDGGLLALHLKKGYNKRPESLTIREGAPEKPVATWKVENIPAPVVVLADPATPDTIGEIQLRPGRRGRLAATIHLTLGLPKDQGVILRPVAATYTTIDTSRIPNGIISKAGETPFDGRLNLPNPTMARFVSFDMQTYKAVVTTETITLKPAKLDSPFGQPTIIVEDDQNVTTPSGIKLFLPGQNDGPKRAPRHPRQEITLRAIMDASGLKGPAVEGVLPQIQAELISPTASELGLAKVNLMIGETAQPKGMAVFGVSLPRGSSAAGGPAKLGQTQPVIIRLTITRPAIVSTKRIVLKVNPKVFPAEVGAGVGTGVSVTAEK